MGFAWIISMLDSRTMWQGKRYCHGLLFRQRLAHGPGKSPYNWRRLVDALEVADITFLDRVLLDTLGQIPYASTYTGNEFLSHISCHKHFERRVSGSQWC